MRINFTFVLIFAFMASIDIISHHYHIAEAQDHIAEAQENFQENSSYFSSALTLFPRIPGMYPKNFHDRTQNEVLSSLNAEQLFQTAKQYYLEKNYDHSLKLAMQSFFQNSDTAFRFFVSDLIGRIYYHQKDFDSAQIWFAKALESFRLLPIEYQKQEHLLLPIWLDYAGSIIRSPKSTENDLLKILYALDNKERKLSESAAKTIFMREIALVSEKLKQYSRAYIWYQQMYYHPNFSETYRENHQQGVLLKLAQIALKLRDQKAASKWLKTFLLQNPTSVQFDQVLLWYSSLIQQTEWNFSLEDWFQMGLVAQERAHHELALSFFDRAINLYQQNPKNPSWYENCLWKKISSYRRTQQFSQAIETINDMLEYEKDSKKRNMLFTQLASMHTRNGNYEQGISIYDNLKAKNTERNAENPQFMPAWYRFESGNYKEARPLFAQYAQMYPQTERGFQSQWYEGYSAYLSGDIDAAMTIFHRIAAENKGSIYAIRSWYWIGRAYEKLQHRDHAVSAYKNAVQLSNDDYYRFAAYARLRELGVSSTLFRIRFESSDLSKSADIEKIKPSLEKSSIILPIAATTISEMRFFLKLGRFESIPNISYQNLSWSEKELLLEDFIQNYRFNEGSKIASLLTQYLISKNLPISAHILKMAYPKPHASTVETYAEQFKIPEHLSYGIMRSESMYRPNITSPTYAVGLMQVLPLTADRIQQKINDEKAKKTWSILHRFEIDTSKADDNNDEHIISENLEQLSEIPSIQQTLIDLYNPKINISLGSWYISKLVSNYRQQIPLAIGSYNAGPVAMNNWVRFRHGLAMDEFIETIPYLETRLYMKRVLSASFIYDQIYQDQTSKSEDHLFSILSQKVTLSITHEVQF